MRVLLAITNTDLRLSIELLLSQEPSFHVVGVASEAEGLVALINSAQPDVVILDWDLPRLSVKQLISLLQNEGMVHFIVLGKEPGQRESILDAGATAFVVKGDPPEALLEAFRHTRAQLGPPPQERPVISKEE